MLRQNFGMNYSSIRSRPLSILEHGNQPTVYIICAGNQARTLAKMEVVTGVVKVYKQLIHEQMLIL